MSIRAKDLIAAGYKHLKGLGGFTKLLTTSKGEPIGIAAKQALFGKVTMHISLPHGGFMKIKPDCLDDLLAFEQLLTTEKAPA